MSVFNVGDKVKVDSFLRLNVGDEWLSDRTLLMHDRTGTVRSVESDGVYRIDFDPHPECVIKDGQEWSEEHQQFFIPLDPKKVGVLVSEELLVLP